MADLKTGAKFIEKDPPLADQETKSIGRKILDYLAYLKEQLNFIFSNYGRRLTDADGHINELIRTADEMSSTIYDPNTGESRIQQNADAISVVVDSNDDIKAASIVAAINDSGSSVIIDADHIALSGYVTFDNLSTSGQSTINGANISSGTVSTTQLDSAITTSISDAASAASAAQLSANGANLQEQQIYISKASGTTSVSANTTWVTDVTGSQNTWTLKRPTYNSSYPVLFVATQRKTVAGTVTCTTPIVDETTTVIDGGHITTGQINAARVQTGILTDNLGKNSWNLDTGALTITDGNIHVTTNSSSVDNIYLEYTSGSISRVAQMNAYTGLTASYTDNGSTRTTRISGSGGLYHHDDGDGDIYINVIGVDYRLYNSASDANPTRRMFLTPTSLTYYNTSGTQTASYPNSLTASRALVTGSGGAVTTSSVTSTELGYLSGVTSNIQNQINNISISPTHLYTGGTYSSATTSYKYTGYYVTIPAGKCFVMTVHAYYSTVEPECVCASNSSTTLATGSIQFEYNTDSLGTRARGTFGGYADTALTYYLWVKGRGSGAVGVSFDGFYL